MAIEDLIKSGSLLQLRYRREIITHSCRWGGSLRRRRNLLVAVKHLRVTKPDCRLRDERTNDLPAHNLQALDFQVFNRRVAGNQGRAKSLGVGRNHDVKCSCTSPKVLGIYSYPGVGRSV